MLLLQTFVYLKLDSESWEPCPFNKIQGCSQAHISNVLSPLLLKKRRKEPR